MDLDGEINDNTKLEKAWNKGWRPYPENTNVENMDELKYMEITKPATKWLLKPENKEYRTQTHIDSYPDDKNLDQINSPMNLSYIK